MTKISFVRACPKGKVCRQNIQYDYVKNHSTGFIILLALLVVLFFYILIWFPYREYKAFLIVLWITGTFILVMYLVIWIQKRGKVVCDNKIFDLWSLIHFLGHLGGALLFIELLHFEYIWSVFMVIGISCLWEIFEEIYKNYRPNFACESRGNHLSDLIFDSLGALSAYFFII